MNDIISKVCDNYITPNINLIDMLGFHKLIRNIERYREMLGDSTQSNEMVSRFQRELLDHIKIHMEKYGILLDIDKLQSEGLCKQRLLEKQTLDDCIIMMCKNNDALNRTANLISDDISIQELSEILISSKYILAPPSIMYNKCMVIYFNEKEYLVNALTRFYKILQLNDFSRNVVELYGVMLNENYIPKGLEDFLSKHIKYNIRITDDYSANQVGTCLTIFMYNGNTALNPIYVIPLDGIARPFSFNLFNRVEEDGIYTGLFQKLFGCVFEEDSPEKHILFQTTRTYRFNNITDVQNVLSYARTKGLQADDILPDINLDRGKELGLQLLMNMCYLSLKGQRGTHLKFLENFCGKIIYPDSAVYLLSDLEAVYRLNVIVGYLMEQMRRLFGICCSYLKEVCNISSLTKESVRARVVDSDSIWDKSNYLVDSANLKDISLWCISTYYTYSDVVMPLDVVSKCITITNYFNQGIIRYLELTSHITGLRDVKLVRVGALGDYELEGILMKPGDENESVTFKLYGKTIGCFCPLTSELCLIISDVTDWLEDRLAKIKLYLPGVLRAKLTDVSTIDTMLTIKDGTVILYCPDTLGVYYYNKIHNQFDDTIWLHPDKPLIIEKCGNEGRLLLIINNQQYYADIKPKELVYTLVKANSNYIATDVAINYKTNIFNLGDDI